MDISFIILTWNSEQHIKRCITSLTESLSDGPFTYEIFIVDNGSTDKTRSIINDYGKHYPEKILPILLDHNTGTTYSRNIALKKAKGNYIAIMDSDVEVFKGTIEKLINVHKKNKNVGLAVPKLTYSNGNYQKSTDNFPTIITKLFRYFLLKSMEKTENRFLQVKKTL